MPPLGGAFGGLLGNSILQQIVLYNVVGSLIGAALSPYLTALTNQVNQASPLVPLSPADAAEAVLRNVMSPADAAAEARFHGVNQQRFDVLARLAGNAPPPEALAEALRRGLIDQGRYLEGVRQGRLRDEWAELVRELSVRNPSPEAPLQAYLEGQLSEGRARELFARFGGNPEHFQWLYDSQGTAPTPTQALELANRGIIPWSGSGAGVVSYEQAFLEGPWRNKWLGPFRALGEYLPPPRTITAMYREGSINRAKAAELLRAQGLAADMVEAYLFSGSSQRTEATKDLAQSTILELYRDRLISRPEAAEALRSLGYDQSEADLVLQVADARLAQRFLNLAIGRVRSRYVGWKITRAQAASILGDLEVPGEGVSDLLTIWDMERTANTATLTAAQVANTFELGMVDQREATSRLEQLGYQPTDAWLYLSQAVGRVLPRQPTAGAGLGDVPEAEVELLTAAQVAKAYRAELLTQDEAQRRLQLMGYRPHEAWLYLSQAAGEALPDEPPPDS